MAVDACGSDFIQKRNASNVARGGAGPGRAAAHRDHGIIALLRAESCESSSHTAERRQDSASLRYDALSLIRATKSTGAVDMDGAARTSLSLWAGHVSGSAPRARTHPPSQPAPDPAPSCISGSGLPARRGTGVRGGR